MAHYFPGDDLLRLWLYTSKTSIVTMGGVTRPGLFSTTNLSWHVLSLLGILILECIATYLAWDEGVNITIIIVFILLDFVFAILFHLGLQNKIKLLENQKLLLRSVPAIVENDKRLKFLKFLKFIGHLILFISGFLKIYFCYRDVFFGQFTSIFFFITVLYLLAALLHCISTGYLFFGLLFNIKDSGRRTKFYESGEVEFVAEHPFRELINNPDKIAIELKEFNNCSINMDGAEYFFNSESYLSDSDLKLLIDHQRSDTGKRLIALEGLRFQLIQLGGVPAQL